MLEIAVITVSDRAYRGEYQDLSGQEIKSLIENSEVSARVWVTVVPDDKTALKEAIVSEIGKHYIITTGGTGISPRDITPEITASICDRELPGIAEMLRRESYRETKYAVLSRGYAGIKDSTIIINFPGSVKAVSLCTRLVLPLLEHGIKMIRGGKH